MQNPRGKPGSGEPTSVLSSAPASTDLKRRRFIFSLSAGGAGAAAALAVTPAVAAVMPTIAAPARTDAGYQETEHVRDYYRTARL
ncbi:MAG: formate dehydrogenase [Casimicrobiaceae bacterium]